MEFQDVLKQRQSCRQFSDKRVERDKLAALMEAGRLSPSACNSQRWMFVGVDAPALCRKIALCLKDEDLQVNLFAGEIPSYIVIVKHPARNVSEKQKYMLSVNDHALIDIGIAAQQICLAATDMGLGSVMLGWARQEPIKELLQIPAELEVPLLIGVGYPKTDTLRNKKREDASQVIRWNSYAPQGEE